MSGLRRAQAECEAALAAFARPVWAGGGMPKAPGGGEADAEDVAWFFEPSSAEGPPGTPPRPAGGAVLLVASGSDKGDAFRDLARGLVPRFPGLLERLAPGALGALCPPLRNGSRPEVAASAVVGPCAPGGFSTVVFPGVVLLGCPNFLAPVAPWACNRFDETGVVSPGGAGGTFAVLVVAAAGPALREQSDMALAEAALRRARALAAADDRPVLVVAGFLVPAALAFRLETAGVSWVGGVSAASLRRCAAVAACEPVTDWASAASARRQLGAARAEAWEGGWDPDDAGSPELCVRRAIVLRPLATRGGSEVAAMPVAAVVCHPVRWVADQAARQMERFLPTLWETWDGGGGTVVPGGGAAELLCAWRLREAGRAVARAAGAEEEPGERELDPLVFGAVADALCDVADRTLAAFDVTLEERLVLLQAGELGGGGGCAPSTPLPESGGRLLGVESLGGKTRALRAAFDAAHIVLDTRATLTNAAQMQ